MTMTSAMTESGPGDAGADPLLEVRGLKKHFPIRSGVLQRHTGDVKAVDGLDFSLARGETLSLVGESGCGKTTAGRSTLRLIEPTAGEAIYRPEAGAEVDLFKLGKGEMRSFRRDLQIIFQDPYASLNPRITVGNAVCCRTRFDPARLPRSTTRSSVRAKRSGRRRSVPMARDSPSMIRKWTG